VTKNEKIVWGKKGQLTEPLPSGDIQWHTFNDIHPRWELNGAKAEQEGLPTCNHCNKGIKSGGWNIRMAYSTPTEHRVVLHNNVSEREAIQRGAETFRLGNECATNLPATHRTKIKE
jgi:hypothetical protein